jgi:RND family efflux transporter MFP subunit
MNSTRRLPRLAALFIAVTLTACEDEAPETVERIRAIKPYYVVEPAGGDVRRYSGTIVAANTSALSFAVSGTVQTVEVSKGDRVVEGQLLATLDIKPFELDVQAARSRVATTQAESDLSKVDLDRRRQLFERGWVAKAALDQAVAASDAAQGELSLARSRLGLAERDQTNASLTAPFAGVIVVRDVEPFVEIAKGQRVLKIASEGALEVDMSIPDSIIGRLTAGAPVTIDALTVAACGCFGRITEIGVAADAANAVPVTAAILESPGGLLPGMAVETSVVLSVDDGPRGFLVPIVAIAQGDDKARGYVFKYDKAAGVVRKTPVRGEGTANGNLIGITEGVDAGDIIAGAGVSFLRDEQRVKLLGE